MLINGKPWTRRAFVKALTGGLAAAGMGATFGACSSSGSTTKKKVIVLGLDGIDPKILKAMIDAGRAPNFKKLAQLGSFQNLGTTMPALSPVAWSSFITGMDPGGHGIADFISRNPETYVPEFAIWGAEEPGRVLSLGNFQIPLSTGGIFNHRKGTPFWSYLTDRGIPSVVIKIPTNFPVDETATRAISGMGTPDLVDTYGIFNYYTSDTFENFGDISGGNIHYVEVEDHRFESFLPGPPNTLFEPKDDRRDPFINHMKLPFTVHRDPERDVLLLEVNDQKVILKKGEYSDWVRLDFEVMSHIPGATGNARFLAKEVHPYVKLYVTHINIDPSNQAAPVTHPPEYGEELAREIGPFWTKGLPCDTKAFDYQVINDEHYVGQAELLLKERMAIFDYEMARFKSGLFYFYVSSTDQDAHMLWRNMDKTHPMHDRSDVRFAGYIHHLYEEMDKLVGKVLPAIDDDTLLLICSDHGFAQFGRQFHLNTWLRENGYLTIKESAKKKDETTIFDVDWSQTLAYGIGFNGLYLNRKGREGMGIVEDSKAEEVIARISRDLQSIADDETGIRPVHKVYRREEMYHGESTPIMPEMLVGYTPGYRNAADSVLGATGKEIINLNPWAWSGDHSMARDLVPGSLFSSRPVTGQNPFIWDLPVTILDFFGIEKPSQMIGRSILKA